MDRREFCVATGCALAALKLTGCGGDAGSSSGLVNVGKPSDYAVGDVKPFVDPHNHYPIICRDAGGIYAVSSDCQHSHCEVEWHQDKTLFICPCHQSEYHMDGSVAQGPTVRPLIHWALMLDPATGDLMVDKSTKVDE